MTAKSRISLLMTGNELMSGDTVDSNSALIARALAESNLQPDMKITTGDDRDLLHESIAQLCKSSDVLIVNGGLGPTADDLTAEILAELAGTELHEHPGAREHVETWCQRRGIEANQSNLKQAFVPRGATLVENPVGSAVGFAIDIYRCRVIATPGVPSELKAMLPSVLERTRERTGGETAPILRLQTFGIGESTIQQRVNQMPDWPMEVELGFRAGMPQLELKLRVESEHQIPAQQACLERLTESFGDHIIGTGDATLAQALQQVLRDQGKTLVTAESCTGGTIASMMTREAGSSAVFHAGYVTYANHVKTALLGVSEADLEEHGAVSEPVVRQMLLGALDRSGADIGVAVSGIAGPDGGTDDKPVGTVWLAWGTTDEVRTRKVVIPGSRQLFQTLVSAAGLDLVRRQLLGLPREPHYFARQAL